MVKCKGGRVVVYDHNHFVHSFYKPPRTELLGERNEWLRTSVQYNLEIETRNYNTTQKTVRYIWNINKKVPAVLLNDLKNNTNVS